MDYRVRLQFPATTRAYATAVKMSRDYGDYSSNYSQSKEFWKGCAS